MLTVRIFTSTLWMLIVCAMLAGKISADDGECLDQCDSCCTQAGFQAGGFDVGYCVCTKVAVEWPHVVTTDHMICQNICPKSKLTFKSKQPREYHYMRSLY